ncbi:MAG: hypothetical protein QOH60_2831 [Mycobacterium sp.]|jgi:hypothetical protein|nr:hypothetical protein [Mycobacterium sp.]
MTDNVLRTWSFNMEDDTVTGACPNCHHTMVYEFEQNVVSINFARENLTRKIDATRKITCACRVTHIDSQGNDHKGCGSYWFVRILPHGATPQVTVERDPLLQHVSAELAEQDSATQEQKVRAAAEKWVGAVTALLGLFGLSGIAFGKDVFASLGTGPRCVMAVALVVSVLAAALAVLRIYRAAYGWPHIDDVSKVSSLMKWYRQRHNAPVKAAESLQWGVYLALTSVVALCVAAGAAIWSGANPPTALVNVTRTDDSRVCGNLLDSKDAGKLRIRRNNGSVENMDASTISKMSTVTKCSG